MREIIHFWQIRGADPKLQRKTHPNGAFLVQNLLFCMKLCSLTNSRKLVLNRKISFKNFSQKIPQKGIFGPKLETLLFSTKILNLTNWKMLILTIILNV